MDFNNNNFIFYDEVTPDNLIDNELSFKRASFVIAFYFLIMLLAGALLYPVLFKNDKFVVHYSETDVILNTLQTKNGIGIIDKIYFENSPYKDGVKFYELEKDYLLITTKGLFSSKETKEIDEEFLHKIFAEGYIHDGYKVYKVFPKNLGTEIFDEYNFTFIPLTDSNIKIRAYSTLNSSGEVIINFVGFMFIVIGVVLVTFQMLKVEFVRLEGFKETLINVLIGMGIVYLLNIAANMISTLLSAFFQEKSVGSVNQQSIEKMLNGEYAFLIILTVVIIGPFIEEMVFRKSIFSLFKNEKAAFIISALSFGVIHVLGEDSFANFMINLFPYVAPGFGLSYIYLKYNKNVLVTTFVHIALNLLSVIIVFLF